MAKRKSRSKTGRIVVSHREVFWPGPTRLYDEDVDCGAVLLTGSQARALLRVCEEALSEGRVIGHDKRWATSACNLMRWAFGVETYPAEDR